MKKFVKNTDLNKTSHFSVAFLQSNCKKLFFGVEQLINGTKMLSSPTLQKSDWVDSLYLYDNTFRYACT